jgi:voltage-gated sodium channel type II alpha
LSLRWYGQDEDLNSYFETLNYVFVGIFSAEFFFKIIAYGFRYFRDPWSIFDSVIITASLGSIFLAQISSFALGPQMTLVRSFRIARVFFLVKKKRGLRTSFLTFLVTLPALLNISLLIVLVLTIYSILGVYLFAPVMLNGALDVHANFQTKRTAFMTLVRVATGEGWPDLMAALSRGYDLDYKCVSNPSYADYVRNNCKN